MSGWREEVRIGRALCLLVVRLLCFFVFLVFVVFCFAASDIF